MTEIESDWARERRQNEVFLAAPFKFKISYENKNERFCSLRARKGNNIAAKNTKRMAGNFSPSISDMTKH